MGWRTVGGTWRGVGGVWLPDGDGGEPGDDPYLTVSDLTVNSGAIEASLDWSDGDGLWTDIIFHDSAEISLPSGKLRRLMAQASGGSGGCGVASNFQVGGASAGENIEQWDVDLDGGTFALVVGEAAAGIDGQTASGNDGSESTGFGLTAAPGLGGGAPGTNGKSGFHGSGAGRRSSGGTGTSGRHGGSGFGNENSGGGGAGIGSSGESANASKAGDGGAGVPRLLGGVATDFAAGGGGTKEGGAQGAAGGDSASAGSAASSENAPTGRGGGSGGAAQAGSSRSSGDGGSGSWVLTLRRGA